MPLEKTILGLPGFQVKSVHGESSTISSHYPEGVESRAEDRRGDGGEVALSAIEEETTGESALAVSESVRNR